MAKNSNKISAAPLVVLIVLLLIYWGGVLFIAYRLAAEGEALLSLFFVGALVLLAGGIRALSMDALLIIKCGASGDE